MGPETDNTQVRFPRFFSVPFGESWNILKSVTMGSFRALSIISFAIIRYRIKCPAALWKNRHSLQLMLFTSILLLNGVRRRVPNCQAFPSITTQIPLCLFCLSKLLSPPKIFLLPLVVSSPTNPIATNRTLKPKGASPFERHASVAYWFVGVVLLFCLNFLVYILIYSPAPLILKWEFRNFFGGPNR